MTSHYFNTIAGAVCRLTCLVRVEGSVIALEDASR
jgi:hypothetical protein